MGRRGQTGSGGAVVSSLSSNSGGTVKGKKGGRGKGGGTGAGRDDEFDFILEDCAPGKKKKTRPAAAAGSASGSASGGGGSSAGWIGKTPVILLREWCIRNDRKRPM